MTRSFTLLYLGVSVSLASDPHKSPESNQDQEGLVSPVSLLDGFEDDYPYWSPPRLTGDAPALQVFSFGYTASFRELIGVDASMKLDEQIVKDAANAAYKPALNDTPNVTLTEFTPIGNITLNETLYQGPESVVISIAEYPNLVIKYQVQCENFDRELHPLMRDAWYMDEASRFGIAPRVVFLSPPSFLCDERKGKCGFFSMSDEYFFECKANGGVVRYLITERVKGVTLDALRNSVFGSPSGAMGIFNAAKLTSVLVKTLRTLHEDAKIVHGDIHTSNVLFDEARGRLILIDFGRAFRLGKNLSETPKYAFGEWGSVMNTMWQIEGYEWAARDDLNKAIQLFAHLMNPRSYQSLEGKIESMGVDIICNWKAYADWFATDDYDPVGMAPVSAGQKVRLRFSLDEVLQIVRELHINGPLPYAALIDQIEKCAENSKPLINIA